MEKTPYEEGYEDGHEVKDYDNPEEVVNPLARLGYLAVGKIAEADRKAEEYDNGYNAGITDHEHDE